MRIEIGTKVEFISGAVATVVDIKVRFNRVKQEYQTNLYIVEEKTDKIESWTLSSFNEDLQVGEVEIL